MRIAISANGKNLDATINDRFGRCPYFLIVETDNMRTEVFENTNADLSTGAGIQAASMVTSKGAQAVITGSCGPKAMQVFSEAGLPVILNQHGVVRDAVETFKNGALSPSTSANVPEKSGISPDAAGTGFAQPGMGIEGGRGLGGGRGMGGGGRGMGMGGGRGMGRHCGGKTAAGPTNFHPPHLSRDQERAQLQQQADACRQQLEAIQNRIKDLT